MRILEAFPCLPLSDRRHILYYTFINRTMDILRGKDLHIAWAPPRDFKRSERQQMEARGASSQYLVLCQLTRYLVKFCRGGCPSRTRDGMTEYRCEWDIMISMSWSVVNLHLYSRHDWCWMKVDVDRAVYHHVSYIEGMRRYSRAESASTSMSHDPWMTWAEQIIYYQLRPVTVRSWELGIQPCTTMVSRLMTSTSDSLLER